MTVPLEVLERHKAYLQKEVEELIQQRISVQNRIDSLNQQATGILDEARSKAESLLKTTDQEVEHLKSLLIEERAKLDSYNDSILARENAVKELELERENLKISQADLELQKMELETAKRNAEEALRLAGEERALWETRNSELSEQTKARDEEREALSKERLSIGSVFADAEKLKVEANTLMEESRLEKEKVSSDLAEIEKVRIEQAEKEDVLTKRSMDLDEREQKLQAVVDQVEADKVTLRRESSKLAHEQAILAQQRLGITS